MAARARTALVPVLALAAHTLIPAANPAVAAEKPTFESRDKKIFEMLDDDHDGVISMPEFKNNQMLIFYVLDRNKDLVLTRNETALPADVFDQIAGSGSKITSIEFMNVVDHAFKNADQNHNSAIDRKEFNALMRRVRE